MGVSISSVSGKAAFEAKILGYLNLIDISRIDHPDNVVNPLYVAVSVQDTIHYKEVIHELPEAVI